MQYNIDNISEMVTSLGFELLENIEDGAFKKITLKCKNGHIFTTTFTAFKQNSSRCPICTKDQPQKMLVAKTLTKFISKLKENQCEIIDTSNFTGQFSTIKYICPKQPGIIQEGYWKSYKNYQYCCFLCGQQGERLNKIISEDQAKIVCEADENREFISVDWNTPPGYSRPGAWINYRCKKHPDQIQRMSYANMSRGRSCPLCGCNKSKGELRIDRWLKKHVDSYQGILGIDRQKTFDDLIDKNHLSYDFYLIDYNLLIEFQGAYHDHTDRRQTEEQYLQQQKHDKIKADYAKAHNIDLLEIWHQDFDNIELILSRKIFGV